jgi:hypothetical protein
VYAERTARKKRPNDVIGGAIAPSEIEEDIDPKSAAAELGSRGGKARAQRLTPEQRHEIAKQGANRRWSKDQGVSDRKPTGEGSTRDSNRTPITFEDYVRVDERARDLGCSLPTTLAVIPLHFETAATRAELHTASHTATVVKLLTGNGILVESFLLPSERPPYVVNKHFQWLGPTLFIPLALLNENPQIVSLAIGVLANCITDFFKGIPKRQRNVKLDLVVEIKKNSVYRKITYDGDLDGLRMLQEIIRNMTK